MWTHLKPRVEVYGKTFVTYYFSKHFPNEFIVSITNFKSSSIQTDAHFVNYGPI